MKSVAQSANMPLMDVPNQSTLKGSEKTDSFLGKFTNKLKQNLQVVLSVIKNTDMSCQVTADADSKDKKDNHQKLDIK